MAEFVDDVLVVGDGPMGLTAALYLARNGLGVHVLGQDKTPVHRAVLRNQPGVPGMSGTEFVRILRQQALDAGARVHAEHVLSLQRIEGRFLVHTPEGDEFCAKYLVLGTGRNKALAEALGLALTPEGNVRIDLNGRASEDGVYAGGNLARGISQVAISTGDGCAIALDIVAREKGEPVHDYELAPAPEANA